MALPDQRSISRSGPWLAGWAVAGLVGAAIGGCSLLVARPDACNSNEDCRRVFGWGSTCDRDGYCEAPTPTERCASTYPDDLFEQPERYVDYRVIGALFDAEVHLDSVQATRLALMEVNEADGLEGRRFGAVFCDYGEGFGDDLDTLEASAEGASWLADVVGVSAIVGPRGSSRTAAAFEALEDRDVLLISPSATSPLLTGLDEPSPSDASPGRLWRTAPPDDIQAMVIVDDLEGRSVTSVAIIAQSGAYGDALADLIEAGFSGEVQRLSYTDSPFGSIADVAALDVQEVVFISSDIVDYVDFFNGAVASDNLRSYYDGRGIFLPDAAFNDQLLEGSMDEATVLFDNVRGTRYLPAQGPLFDTFSAAFATQYGANPESSGFTVHTYDATWLVLYAFAWARFNEDDEGGRSLARGLRRVSEGDSVQIRFSGWSDVLSAFEAGNGIDVEGGSGSLDYDPSTEETTAAVEVWGIDAPTPGNFEFVQLAVVP